MKPVERLTLVDHKKRGCVVNGLTEVAVDLDAVCLF